MTSKISYYVEPGYVDPGYVEYFIEPTIPENIVIPVTKIIPSYLYQQYKPDENVESFFTAYNIQAQLYFDYINTLNLPIWTSDTIYGLLLDWVAQSLYGFKRPNLTYGHVKLEGGVYNSSVYNSIPYNEGLVSGGNIAVLVNDDIFKRCLTWNLYRGDGYQFTARWLKNRVYRFLIGLNGAAFQVGTNYLVSVTYGTTNNIDINLGGNFETSIVDKLAAAIFQGAVQLPFQYSYTVTP